MRLPDGSLARRLVALCTIAALSGAVAHAATPAAPDDGCGDLRENRYFAADATHPGVITLHFFDAGGAKVTFYECRDGHPVELGARQNPPGTPTDATVPTTFEAATTWSCVRRSRRFAAAALRPDGKLAVGAYSVRTPSCAQRLEIRVPRRADVGAVARVRVADRWGLGRLHATLCVAPPRGERSCEDVRFARAVGVVTRRIRANAAGRWHAELRYRGHRLRSSFVVGDGAAADDAAPPIVLATGDSTMQGIDSFLGDELGDGFVVRSDVRPGSQISRTTFWPDRSRTQARRQHPDFTVMSVGAATDGFPMTTPAGLTVECCDEPWIAEYTRRVRALARTYRRHGRGHVLWLTLPAPRYPPRARIAAAVNAAIVRAGSGMSGVTVVRIDEIFSPDGYRETIRYRGRDVAVREPDGIHLNISGTAIAAKVIARGIRAIRRR